MYNLTSRNFTTYNHSLWTCNVWITRHKNDTFKHFQEQKKYFWGYFFFSEVSRPWKTKKSQAFKDPWEPCIIVRNCKRANRSKMPITLAIATKCVECSISADDRAVNTRLLPVHRHLPHLHRSPPAEHFVHQSQQRRSFPTSAGYRPDWTAAENSVPETATVCSWADAGSSTFRILERLSSADSLPETHAWINLRRRNVVGRQVQCNT